jgi:hypothetical protein
VSVPAFPQSHTLTIVPILPAMPTRKLFFNAVSATFCAAYFD